MKTPKTPWLSIAIILAVSIFFSVVISRLYVKDAACTSAGGILLNGICIKKDAIILDYNGFVADPEIQIAALSIELGAL